MSAPLGAGVELTAVGDTDGTQLASYQLPLTGRFVVESVVADIDASADVNDVRPTLVLRDKSGRVITTKRLGDSIPAGDTGSATWALRLPGEAPGAGGITRIVSPDGSVTVVHPTGPTVDLTVPPPPASGDARRFGYLTWQIFRPQVPFDLVVFGAIATIVGTRANGVTIGNLYELVWTWEVDAHDYLSLFFQNESGGTRQVQLSQSQVQLPGTGTEDVGTAVAPANVLNHGGYLFPMAHGVFVGTVDGASLLDFTTPTKPFFKAAGTYNIRLRAYISFLP